MRYFYETFLSQSTILTNLWGKIILKRLKIQKNNNHRNLQSIL